MTIYRRRLTSSFLAIERSLTRRRAVLLGGASAAALVDADDLAAVEASMLLDLDDLPEAGKALARETRELGEFLVELARRTPDESKMTYLHDELEDAFRSGHDTVVLFTQYTDTLDYLRDQLLPWYGAKIACYSGRGGERWNSATRAWVPATKAEVKTLFREGQEVKILIGTDALSEGLNLQTCGRLFNYDMPWNFMRVEQRIGRVDRIGGKPVVEVSNYFYQGTVEEQIYSGIRRDYDWFTDIVGPAQPVLSQMEAILENVAMTEPGERRQALVADRVVEIRQAIEAAKARAVSLADFGRSPLPGADDEPAIDLAGLERVLLGASATRDRFTPHPAIPGAYLLAVGGAKQPVTFRRPVLDRHAPDVRLLTYGTEELDMLLREIGVVAPSGDAFDCRGVKVRSLRQLETVLGMGG
jgi:hypothetical protein